MFYLPRICEHCLNPSCVASCPSGAMYKREEDGIVLVDQDKCRGWRFCVSGCPYKKVYFNQPHREGREVHALLPAHRGRTADDLLGDLRRTHPLPRPRALRRRPRAGGGVGARRAGTARRAARVFLDPEDPDVRAQARRDGIPTTGSRLRGAPRFMRWRCAIVSPCRCTPSTGRCRWSGTCRRFRRSSARSKDDGYEADPDDVFPAIDRCGSRSSTSPTCSPPATPAVVRRGASPARSDARLHAQARGAGKVDDASSRGRSA